MSFLDSFKAIMTPAAAPAPASASAPAAPAAAPSSANPAAPSNVDGSNTPANPADLYAKMWDNATNAAGDAPPSLQYDPAVLDKVSSGMDFIKGIDPALVQKASSGDAKAMMDMMQAVGRNAYRASLEHNGAVVDNFVGRREQHLSKNIPGLVRNELTMGSLFEGGEGKAQLPAFAKEQLADTARRIQAAHPTASPQEVAAAARKYFLDMNNAVNQGAPSKSSNEGAPGSFDWDSWADQQYSSSISSL